MSHNMKGEDCPPTKDEISRKRLEVYCKKYERPPANKLITRKLSSEANYDLNAWSDKHWEDILKERKELTQPVNSNTLCKEEKLFTCKVMFEVVYYL